jgi:hypothetical protein
MSEEELPEPVKAGANISVDTLEEFWETSTQSELISS